MIKKILLLITFTIALFTMMGCAVPAYDNKAPEQIQEERSDLVVINLGTEKLPDRYGQASVYILYFEGDPPLKALPESIKVSFNSNLERPVVKIGRLNDHYWGFAGDVEIIFRNRAQMANYWLVR